MSASSGAHLPARACGRPLDADSARSMERHTMRLAPALVATAMTVTALVVVPAAPAFADERVCRGSLGAVTVDNLRVPSGASCTLDRTTVKGTLKIETGASLVATGIRVVGNVQGEGSRSVRVTGAVVGGSVQIKQGGAASVVTTRVNGDIQYDEMTQALRADSNVVGGNIQVVKNFGGVAINSNRIDGALQCKENRPAPTGRGNVAGEGKEGQCRAL